MVRELDGMGSSVAFHSLASGVGPIYYHYLNTTRANAKADLTALYNEFKDRSLHLIYLMGTGTHKILLGFRGTSEYGQFMSLDYSGSNWQVYFRIYAGETSISI